MHEQCNTEQAIFSKSNEFKHPVPTLIHLAWQATSQSKWTNSSELHVSHSVNQCFVHCLGAAGLVAVVSQVHESIAVQLNTILRRFQSASFTLSGVPDYLINRTWITIKSGMCFIAVTRWPLLTGQNITWQSVAFQ